MKDMVESRSERRPAEDHLNCLLPIVLQSLNRAYVLSFRQCTLIPEKILCEHPLFKAFLAFKAAY